MNNKKIYTLAVTGILLASVSQQATIKASALGLPEKVVQSKSNVVNDDGTISNRDGSKTMIYGGCVTLKSGTDVRVPACSIIKPSGDIQLPRYGEATLIDFEVTVTSGQNGCAPMVNADGTIVVPKGSEVETANGVIKVPEKSVVREDGTILVKNKGEVQLTNGVREVVPEGSVLNTWDPYECINVPSGKSVVLKTDGEEVTVTSKAKGENIIVSPDGGIKVPDGGSVKTPRGEVVLPSESVLNTDGSVLIQSFGSVEFPNGEKIEVCEGDVISRDGSLGVQGDLDDGDDWYWNDDFYLDDDWY